ncbi:MAG TPA: imidazolonepropionase [Anaerolineaceae bacterium]|jgi:imidazolonepropionase|nr:imidazolonepropionase [Anaerolineaceae bacterium]
MLLIHNTSFVYQLTLSAQRGSALGALNPLPKGAVLLEGERILAVGAPADLLLQHPEADLLDAGGNAVLPGFVDPHTHLVWAGDRANEFEMRLQGKSYMEIMAAGGGIAATLKATRAASLEQLLEETRPRAQSAFRHGTTTLEAKTGYGLDLETEYKQMEVLLRLDEEGPLQIIPTYLGAHALPPEFQGDTAGYVRFLTRQALPELKSWWQSRAPGRSLPFVDVFCEEGVFDLEQTRGILDAAAELGFPLKLHADEFANLGGASLAVELGAVSADHLVKTSAEDIRKLAKSNTVAVSLPGTPFGLAQSEYTPAREIVAAGGLLALATDLNPGTSWNESMQFIQALACRYLKLTPAEALAASTINAAAALGLADLLGSLSPGKQADLIILKVPDARMLSYRYGTNLVSTVIKKGAVYPAD